MKKLSLYILALLVFQMLLSAVFPIKTQQELNKEALGYCKSNGMNTDFYVLIDMRIHSGKNRLFMINPGTNEVLAKGLCSHGCCDSAWADDQSRSNPVFSNESGSHCTSLGKYKVGKRGWSNWGINVNYKLHGLEESNSNAYERQIVLHSWSDIPDYELYPLGTPEGWGCPAVSDNVMRQIDAKLKASVKPVLMWVYK